MPKKEFENPEDEYSPEKIKADKKIKEIVKRRLSIDIIINILFLFIFLAIFITLYRVGFSFIQFRPTFTFTNKELTYLFFTLLGLDFLIMCFVLSLPIAHRLSILIYLIKKRFRRQQTSD
jgi:hypothetical protein